MRMLSAREIAKAVNGVVILGCADTIARKLSIDTRTLEADSLFIPLRGEKYDAHRFIPNAVKKGATVLLTDKDGEYRFKGVTVIRVDDTLNALHRLAYWYRRLFNVDFIAVTGSTGKTTTKNMIARVLEYKYPVLKTSGNYNNHIGLPVTIMNLRDEHKAAVIEMGMSGFGEIRKLAHIVEPRISVITNIGTSHIELLGSRENILKAKMEIFEQMPSDAKGVINADDVLLSDGTKRLTLPLVTYGIHSGDYSASHMKSMGQQGTTYMLEAEGGHYQVTVPLPGTHNVYNSLAAVAVGRLMGMDFEEIIFCLKDIKQEKMRLNILTTAGGIKIINDVYNASPDSMKAALEVLDEIAEGRKIAVLADMLEMGDFAKESHRMVGEYVKNSNVDILITVGDNSLYIGAGATDKGMNPDNIYHFASKEKAAKLLDDVLINNDTVLFKGSRGMRMEELVIRTQERS